MPDTTRIDARRFAAHVHEVVELHGDGASFATLETRVNSMAVADEQQSALWLLAFSLRNGANAYSRPGLAPTAP